MSDTATVTTANGTTTKPKPIKDPRMGSAQVPKFTLDQADKIAKTLDFSPKYVYAAAVQVLSQLDTKQQLQFARDAQDRYAEAGQNPAPVPAPAPAPVPATV